jgi:hypothetical protein
MLSGCLEKAAPHLIFTRYLNGVVLLARNLAVVSGGGAIAWQSNAGPIAIRMLCDLLARPNRAEQDEKLLKSILQFIANMVNEIAESNHPGSPMRTYEGTEASCEGPEQNAPGSEVTSPRKAQSSSVLGFLLETIQDKAMEGYRQCLSGENDKPALLILEASARNPRSQPGVGHFLSDGETIFLTLLDRTEDWYTVEDHYYSRLLNSIATSIIVSGNSRPFLDKFKE